MDVICVDLESLLSHVVGVCIFYLNHDYLRYFQDLEVVVKEEDFAEAIVEIFVVEESPIGTDHQYRLVID